MDSEIYEDLLLRSGLSPHVTIKDQDPKQRFYDGFQNRYSGPLTHYFFTSFANEDDVAQDLWRQTLYNAFCAAEKGIVALPVQGGTKKFTGWVYTIASNVGKNYLRFKGRQNNFHEHVQFVDTHTWDVLRRDPHEHLACEELEQVVENTLDTMPEVFSSTYRAVYPCGPAGGKLLDGEVAVAMEIPISTVKTRVFRARKRIRESVDTHLQQH